MVAEISYGAMVLALLVALYGICAAIYGARKKFLSWVESARIAMILTWPLISIAVFGLIYLLLDGHYEVQYVYSVTSNSVPSYLKLPAMWGGQAGSIIFWSCLLSAFISVAALREWERERELLPWVIIISLFTLAFFLILTIFIENPFVRFWQMPDGSVVSSMFRPAVSMLLIPDDGLGLNPLLRHIGMILHPPMQYLGFVSFVIPYAFVIAVLITGRKDEHWIRIVRRWMLIAWLFLSLGLLLGSRWSYDVLGWGGYWGWDPVEIAALMPWLSGTAFLHSVMIQEKRGLFKRWNMVLIVLTYLLVIFGTFVTRSGLLSSVHAFAQSAIGPLLFVFIGLNFTVSLGLLIFRWGRFRSESYLTSLLSRESLFLVNNLLLMGILAVCFLGVIFPLVSELLTGQKVTVGPPYYERATGPLFASLLLLMGITPLSAWGRSTAVTMGRAVWKPLAASLVILAVILLNGVRSLAALLGFWLAAFVGSVVIYQFARGVVVRRRRWKESIPTALLRLVDRNRRRYGGYITHLGVVLMAIGIIGIELFQVETQGAIPRGGTLTLRSYTLTYEGLNMFDVDDGRNVARAVIGVAKNGVPVGELYPRNDFYYDSQMSISIPGVHSTPAGDLYVVLVGWEPISTMGATFKVYHMPLVNWLWTGGLVFILGTLAVVWPQRSMEKGD